MDVNTIVLALIGGSLIGLSAGLLYLFNGKIAGISGMMSQLIIPHPKGQAIAFIVGLIAAGVIATGLGLAMPKSLGVTPVGLMIAGLLVGIGTRLSNGCTSGHGICGIGRLSPRSFVAVATFMVTGGLTVFVLRHAIGA